MGKSGLTEDLKENALRIKGLASSGRSLARKGKSLRPACAHNRIDHVLSWFKVLIFCYFLIIQYQFKWEAAY